MAKGKNKDDPSRDIPDRERRLLWVRAGGRCELCNRYLLDDRRTRKPVNFGEMAHNVGHKQNSASPRGLADLDPSKRNDADNLLLLCSEEHKSIDDKLNSGQYTVEYLRERKRRHEERIRHVTGLSEDQQTTVLRVVGNVRGAPVELSDQTAASAVLATGKLYPRFELGLSGSDIEIDLRNFPTEDSVAYLQAAQSRIDEVLGGRLLEAVARGQIRHLSVFALARIPLLAYLGGQIDDKVPVELFQKQRGGDEGWGWDDAADPVEFEITHLRSVASSSEVVLLLAVSAPLTLSDVPTELDGASVWSISPRSQAPSRDTLRSRESLDNFNRTYHEFLATAEGLTPKPAVIDLLPAVPASVAVSLGRGLMKGSQFAARVYDRPSFDSPFEFALELNA